MIGIIVLVLGLTLLLFTWYDTRQYEDISASSGHNPTHTINQFSLLKSRGIKCRLKSVGGIRAAQTGAAGASCILYVHRKDLQQARQILAETEVQ